VQFKLDLHTRLVATVAFLLQNHMYICSLDWIIIVLSSSSQDDLDDHVDGRSSPLQVVFPTLPRLTLDLEKSCMVL
jgi:hypothetical protein